MNWNKIQAMWDLLDDMGVSPFWGICGIGGWLRNTPNRDILSSAYKLCSIGHPVVKIAEVETKMSVPGPCIITRKEFPSVKFFDEEGDDIKRIYYDKGFKTELSRENFNVIRNRVINEFNLGPTKNYGGLPVLSQKIRDIQKGFKLATS